MEQELIYVDYRDKTIFVFIIFTNLSIWEFIAYFVRIFIGLYVYERKIIDDFYAI